MASTKEMTSGAPLPLILNFTLPLLLGNLLQQTYSLVDAAIVGKFLGINALASVGASSSVIFLILGFCNGCCGGFGIPIAQKFGAHDYSTMRKYVWASLKLTTVMSVLIAIVTSLLCAFILRTMRTPENIFYDAYLYLLITFIGVPCTFFYNLFSCIIRALGDSKTPFWFLLFSTILNFDRRLALNMLGIGVPMGLQFSITAIGSIMLQSANNALGTACVAAFTSAMRIKMFFLCPLESLGMAMATYCGQNYGAGKPERIWSGIKSSFLLMGVYVVANFVILWFGAKYMALMFVSASEVEIIKDTELFLHVAATFFPMLGLLCILRYSIQGVGYTTLAMLSGVSEMIARILVSVLAVPAFGYIAVCFGDPTAWMAADLFLVPTFIVIYRRLKSRGVVMNN